MIDALAVLAAAIVAVITATLYFALAALHSEALGRRCVFTGVGILAALAFLAFYF